jgi:hypothetical protein
MNNEHKREIIWNGGPVGGGRKRKRERFQFRYIVCMYEKVRMKPI